MRVGSPLPESRKRRRVGYFRGVDTCVSRADAFQNAQEEHNIHFQARERPPWERELKEILQGDTDFRRIHWYWVAGEADLTAGSLCAKDLYFNAGAAYFTGGSAVQIMRNYEYQPIVVFDLTASGGETPVKQLYVVLECLKDGIFSFGKYPCKAFPVPHVVVFSSSLPNESKLNKDRFVVHRVGS